MKENYQHHFLFHRQNFYLVIAGVVLMLLGFLVMNVPVNPDPNVYDAENLYGFRATVLAPFLVLLGLGVQIVAILYPPKSR